MAYKKREPFKLKIAQITPYYYPSIGGVETVVKYLSEKLFGLEKRKKEAKKALYLNRV